MAAEAATPRLDMCQSPLNSCHSNSLYLRLAQQPTEENSGVKFSVNMTGIAEKVLFACGGGEADGEEERPTTNRKKPEKGQHKQTIKICIKGGKGMAVCCSSVVLHCQNCLQCGNKGEENGRQKPRVSLLPFFLSALYIIRATAAMGIDHEIGRHHK